MAISELPEVKNVAG